MADAPHKVTLAAAPPADPQVKGAPAAPKVHVPARTAKYYKLWDNVVDALYALPGLFSSDLSITGVLATDLHAFNTSLGASIEQQVVENLNKLRQQWDPDDEYPLLEFQRQSQRFPDVILRNTAQQGSTPVLGIELKGWYVLAKEGEPSFRYSVTPAVCSEYDLLVVYPWALTNVVSGAPLLFTPYVVPARYAAEYKNYFWQYLRTTTGDRGITLSSATTHYPLKSDPISDRPAADGGGNFGRVARTNAMDAYVHELMADTLSGIPLWAWQKFLKLFSEDADGEAIARTLRNLAAEVAQKLPRTSVSDLHNALLSAADALTE